MTFREMIRRYTFFLVVLLILGLPCIVIGASYEALTPEQKKWFNENSMKWKTLRPKPLYMLPFPAGEKRSCLESWFDKRTHADPENAYAWDFTFAPDNLIVAARTGTVQGVVQDKGEGPNKIMVGHSDRTVAVYAHIRDGGSLVKQGDKVNVGDPLGYCGPQLKHLHFAVWFWSRETGNTSIPIAFRDYPKTNGIPHLGAVARSQNQRITDSVIKKFEKAIDKAATYRDDGKPGKALKQLEASDIEIWSDALKRAEDLRKELNAAGDAALAAAEALVAEQKFEEAENAFKEIQKVWSGSEWQDTAKDRWRKIQRSDDYKTWKKEN